MAKLCLCISPNDAAFLQRIQPPTVLFVGTLSPNCRSKHPKIDGDWGAVSHSCIGHETHILIFRLETSVKMFAVNVEKMFHVLGNELGTWKLSVNVWLYVLVRAKDPTPSCGVFLAAIEEIC